MQVQGCSWKGLGFVQSRTHRWIPKLELYIRVQYTQLSKLCSDNSSYEEILRNIMLGTEEAKHLTLQKSADASEPTWT